MTHTKMQKFRLIISAPIWIIPALIQVINGYCDIFLNVIEYWINTGHFYKD